MSPKVFHWNEKLRKVLRRSRVDSEPPSVAPTRGKRPGWRAKKSRFSARISPARSSGNMRGMWSMTGYVARHFGHRSAPSTISSPLLAKISRSTGMTQIGQRRSCRSRGLIEESPFVVIGARDRAQPRTPSTSLAAGRRVRIVNGDVAPVDQTDRDVVPRRDVNVVIERRISRSPIDHLDLIGDDSTEARPLDLGVAAPDAVPAGAVGSEAMVATIGVDGERLHINGDPRLSVRLVLPRPSRSSQRRVAALVPRSGDPPSRSRRPPHPSRLPRRERTKKPAF